MSWHKETRAELITVTDSYDCKELLYFIACNYCVLKFTASRQHLVPVVVAGSIVTFKKVKTQSTANLRVPKNGIFILPCHVGVNEPAIEQGAVGKHETHKEQNLSNKNVPRPIRIGATLKNALVSKP